MKGSSMILAKYAENTYVIKETDQQINLAHLNEIINNFLKNRNELRNDSAVKRAIRYSGYIIICCYASLSKETLFEFITTFLTEYNIDFEIKELTKTDLDIIYNLLPIVSVRKNDQHGGVNNDTPTIDPNVLALSEVLNKYDGITTFSSCEGHVEKSFDEANFYILFKVNNQLAIDILSKDLWVTLEDVMRKFKINPPELLFDYGDWPSVMSTYYEIRVKYIEQEQEQVFKAMDYLAKLLNERLTNGSN